LCAKTVQPGANGFSSRIGRFGYAALSAAFAGNAVPTEFALVIVRGLALCFPELFEATPRAWRRRSDRLGGL
jgi:hypothetical protein